MVIYRGGGRENKHHFEEVDQGNQDDKWQEGTNNSTGLDNLDGVIGEGVPKGVEKGC